MVCSLEHAACSPRRGTKTQKEGGRGRERETALNLEQHVHLHVSSLFVFAFALALSFVVYIYFEREVFSLCHFYGALKANSRTGWDTDTNTDTDGEGVSRLVRWLKLTWPINLIKIYLLNFNFEVRGIFCQPFDMHCMCQKVSVCECVPG